MSLGRGTLRGGKLPASTRAVIGDSIQSHAEGMCNVTGHGHVRFIYSKLDERSAWKKLSDKIMNIAGRHQAF